MARTLRHGDREVERCPLSWAALRVAGTGMTSLLIGYDAHRLATGRLAHAAFPAAGNAPSVCVLTPASIEGPFYIDGALVRNDIRDDCVGQDVRLRLQVVDVNSGCNPIQNAVVDIWHCDAGGFYSGYHHTPMALHVPKLLHLHDTTWNEWPYPAVVRDDGHGELRVSGLDSRVYWR